jgi:hypothetical protein
MRALLPLVLGIVGLVVIAALAIGFTDHTAPRVEVGDSSTRVTPPLAPTVVATQTHQAANTAIGVVPPTT